MIEAKVIVDTDAGHRDTHDILITKDEIEQIAIKKAKQSYIYPSDCVGEVISLKVLA